MSQVQENGEVAQVRETTEKGEGKQPQPDLTTQPLKCQFCSEMFLGIYKLNKHLTKIHKAILNIKCNLCGESFKRNKDVIKHLKKVHKTKAGSSSNNEKPPKLKTPKKKKSTKEKNAKEIQKLKHVSDLESTFLPPVQGPRLPSPVFEPPPATPEDWTEPTGWGWVDDDPEPEHEPGIEDKHKWDWDSSFTAINLCKVTLTDSATSQGREDLTGNEFLEPPKPTTEKVVPVATNEDSETVPGKLPRTFDPHEQSTSRKIDIPESALPPPIIPIDIALEVTSIPKQISIVNKLQDASSLIFLSAFSAPFLSTPEPAFSPDFLPGEFYSCSKCDLTFVSSTVASVHAMVHTLRVDASYRCPKCYKKFFKLQDYHDHSHDKDPLATDEKPREKNFECPKCPMKFSTRRPLTKHINTRHRPRLFRCPECTRSYTNLRSLREHILYHQKPKLSCSTCGKEYRNPSHLRVHESSHSETGDYKFICKICNKAFKKGWDLNRHKLTHTQGEDADPHITARQDEHVECQVCGRTLLKKSLGHHLKLHKGTMKIHMCPHCGRKFHDTYSYNKHLLSHTGPSDSICEHCGRGPFASAELFEEHKKLHAMTFICEICGKNFKNKNSLREHMKLHQERERKWQCEDCGWLCLSKYNLQVHRAIHTKDKPINCEFCDYGCGQGTLLMRHIFKVHFGPEGFQANEKEGKPNTFECESCGKSFPNQACLTFHLKYHQDEKPIKCTKCPQAFHTKYDLQLHNKSAHKAPKKPKEPVTRIYPCEHCPKTFKSKQSLQTHERYQHTLETPFACHLCEKKYKSHSDLNYHIAIHNGNYRHTCPICGKRTITKGNMNAHLRTHTNPVPCGKCFQTFPNGQAYQGHLGECPGDYKLDPLSSDGTSQLSGEESLVYEANGSFQLS